MIHHIVLLRKPQYFDADEPMIMGTIWRRLIRFLRILMEDTQENHMTRQGATGCHQGTPGFGRYGKTRITTLVFGKHNTACK